MAHQDVVPVVAKNWEKPPFSGVLMMANLFGGAVHLDDKGSLVSILEAVEKLLSEGITPERTIYLAFGDDEEVNGKGAQSIAAALKRPGCGSRNGFG